MNRIVKISIIIPVYNCELYIEQCIKSVQAQTCNEIEIICIDDGSTDNSVEVIKMLQLDDRRIVLLQQCNNGAGSARNLGIQMARGKYLAFLDADDYYGDVNALEDMICICNIKNVNVCGSVLWKKCIGGVEKIENVFREFQTNVCDGNVYDYMEFQLDYGYTNFIFSAQMIKDNSISFPSYRRFQDPPFMVKAMYAAKKFAVADTYLYCYRMPSSSTRYNNSKVRDLLCGLRDNLIFAVDNGLDILFSNTLGRIDYEYISVICHNISDNDLHLISLLLEINGIVRSGLKDEEYIIRPLKRILGSVIFENGQYEDKLLGMIKDHKRIALYGGGKFAKLFIKLLRQENLIEKVCAILVTDVSNNPSDIEGIKVISFYDFMDTYDMYNLPFIIVTLCGLYQKEVYDYMVLNGINGFELVDDMFLDGLEGRF